MYDQPSRRSGCRLVQAARALCANADFEASDRLRKLLVFLAEAAERTPERKVSQQEIAQAVMGLGETFNPSSDAHVRIEIGRLRKALAGYYGTNGAAARTRIEIPKGGYRPVLKELHPVHAGADETGAPQEDLVVIAAPAVEDAALRDLAEAAFIETLRDCAKSPLMRSGLIGISIVGAGSLDSVHAASRALGASAFVHTSIGRERGVPRIQAVLANTRTGKLARVATKTVPAGQFGDALDWMRGRIAGWVSDPMLGVVPEILAAQSPSGTLKACMAGYRHITRQRQATLFAAVPITRYLTGENPEAAYLQQAIAVDMGRAGTVLGAPDCNVSQSETLERAEIALAGAGADCITTKLAYGYAELYSGNMGRAEAAARQALEIEAPASILADAKMLLALTETPARIDDKTEADSELPELFMHDCRKLISAVRCCEPAAAAGVLLNGRHPHSLWHHIFGAAVFAHEGDEHQASRSFRCLEALWPGFSDVRETAIGSYFAEDHVREFLTDGIRRASQGAT